MKFQITFKDPDGVFEDTAQAADTYSRNINNISEKERKLLADAKLSELNEFITTWIEYGEYIIIEFDTEANTATVIKQ